MTSVDIPEYAFASKYRTIAVGEQLFRCHRLEFGGTDFNPGIGPAGRFTPLISPQGEVIPSLYAATSFDAAVYETLFRQESTPASRVFLSKVNAVGVSCISVRRELSLVPLFTPELRIWKVNERALFSPNLSSYIVCRTLASRIWRDNPKANGLVWRSHQDSESNAYLLFGDRFNKKDLLVKRTQSAGTDNQFHKQIYDAAQRAGIRVE